MAKLDFRLFGTAAVVATLAVAAAFLVTASHDFSKDRIAANERARLVARLNSVLDPSLHGRDLRTVQISAADPLLGGGPIGVFVLSDGDEPAATIFATVAPDGYNAPIHLLVGVSPSGTLTGVRAVSHRETPGLGGQIDAAKSDWIRQFDGKSLEMPQPSGWAVKKDDGQFDSLTGATVTSRAVVKAVENTLLYFDQHKTELYRAAAAAAADAHAE